MKTGTAKVLKRPMHGLEASRDGKDEENIEIG
jgi:hypothetical protein